MFSLPKIKKVWSSSQLEEEAGRSKSEVTGGSSRKRKISALEEIKLVRIQSCCQDSCPSIIVMFTDGRNEKGEEE